MAQKGNLPDWRVYINTIYVILYATSYHSTLWSSPTTKATRLFHSLHAQHKSRFNSLAPGRFEQNFRQVIFKLISVTDGWGISCKIALRCMLLDLTDDKSTLIEVMAWCRQAPSHYLSQCWPRSLSPYGVTRPQWVNCSVLWTVRGIWKMVGIPTGHLST